MNDSKTILEEINQLTEHHSKHCDAYGRYVASVFEKKTPSSFYEVPYVPVRAFKELELKSISTHQIYKTMTSSGTTGRPSKIYLDKETANRQTRGLIKTFVENFGGSRFPMLIIDCPSTISDRRKYSARTAGINGFSMFSRKRCFALREDLSINSEDILTFIESNKGQTIFIFGFTFMIWKYFVECLKREKIQVDLTNSFLLHGGGWKKLESEKVSPEVFKKEILEVSGCASVHNYYGMIEQTGSIFIECIQGNMHGSPYSHVVARDPYDHTPIGYGKLGLIQVFSTLQFSYPGHSVLTEDLGYVFPGQTCSCGNPGDIIQIEGRLQDAEIRGCSDAYL